MPRNVNVYDVTRLARDVRLGSDTYLGPSVVFSKSGQGFFSNETTLINHATATRANRLYRFQFRTEGGGAYFQLRNYANDTAFWRGMIYRDYNLLIYSSSDGFMLVPDTAFFSGYVQDFTVTEEPIRPGRVVFNPRADAANATTITLNRLPIAGKSITVSYNVWMTGGANTRVRDASADQVGDTKLVTGGSGYKTVTYTAANDYIAIEADTATFTGYILDIAYQIG